MGWGFNMATVTSDVTLLVAGAKAALGEMRAKLGQGDMPGPDEKSTGY